MQSIGSRYRIIGDVPLGRGASGVVYQGEDTGGLPVAIKLLHEHLTDDPAVVARFTHERRVLAGVRDPHVVSIRDLVVEGNTLAIVMDYVEGPTLQEWIASTPDVTADDVARIGSDIARGLAALHAADVVHRDLKPANILIDQQGEPRITDFGIATLLDEGEDATSALGTPLYIAPETLRLDPVTAVADVYALGLILYELASGVPAFSGSTRQVAKAQLELMPGRLEYLPESLWQLIQAAVSKDPAARPPAGRLAAQLERLRSSLDATTPMPRLSVPPVPQVAVLDQPTEQLTTQALQTKVLPMETGYPQVVSEPDNPGRRWAPAWVIIIVFALLVAGGAAALLVNQPKPVVQGAPAAVTPTQTVVAPTATVTVAPKERRQRSASLYLCDGLPYPFNVPLSTYNASSTLSQAQASGDSAAIRRATAMASIQAEWQEAGELGPTNGKLFSPLGDLGPQGSMLIATIQNSEGLAPTGEVDARTWEVLQEWYC